MQLLTSQNFYPDLISMVLEVVPFPANSTNGDRFDLYLSLKFSQQWSSLLNGRIKLALKGGQLKLRLENSRLHDINSQLDDRFEMTSEASETKQTWKFTLKTPKSVLTNSLEGIKLGTIEIIDRSSTLTATWTIIPANITLIDAEDLWRHDLSPNKHGVLDRAIAFFLCQDRLSSSLSYVRLGTSNLDTEASYPEENQSEINSQASEEFQQLIQQIYQAKTDKIDELVQLTKLNLKTDFAGSNLLAANLSGIDLNGANLQQANLRGVDLTDADLSEANLRNINLSGADLSGAYIENANLEQANLYRASLALANLIGANLSNANLQEANLSDTNLSRAIVAGAKFGQNTGLSESTKLNLLQKSAKETIVSE